MGKNKIKKNEPLPSPVDPKRFKTSLIRICLLIITVVIICFCIFVMMILQDMDDKVTDMQANLHLVTKKIDITNDHVKTAVTKINDSWLLSW